MALAPPPPMLHDLRPAMSEYRARLGDRSLFPDLEARAYLAHAAISPPSLAVRAAVEGALGDYARYGAEAWSRYRDQRDRLRGKLARLIGAAADEVALVGSTTAGVIAIAQCLPWRKGERVVVFAGEFPTNVTPWQQAAARYGLEVVMQDADRFRTDPGEAFEVLEAALRDGVRVVAVSAVQFQSGLRMPLARIAELCHAYGAELFVDAIQAVGVTPLDVRGEDIDYLACGSHKGLMGPEGCGFVFARRESQRALRPVLAGWLSHEDAASFLFEGPGRLRYDRPVRKSIDFLEAGAQNTLGFAGLEAAVDGILALGVREIAAHVQGYLDELETGLRALGLVSRRASEPAARSSILAIEPPAGVDAGRLHRSLQETGVACSTPDGLLRFSPHWPNAREEIPCVVDAMARAIAEA